MDVLEKDIKTARGGGDDASVSAAEKEVSGLKDSLDGAPISSEYCATESAEFGQTSVCLYGGFVFKVVAGHWM